jgi:hypothetical protein
MVRPLYWGSDLGVSCLFHVTVNVIQSSKRYVDGYETGKGKPCIQLFAFISALPLCYISKFLGSQLQ